MMATVHYVASVYVNQAIVMSEYITLNIRGLIIWKCLPNGDNTRRLYNSLRLWPIFLKDTPLRRPTLSWESLLRTAIS